MKSEQFQVALMNVKVLRPIQQSQNNINKQKLLQLELDNHQLANLNLTTKLKLNLKLKKISMGRILEVKKTHLRTILTKRWANGQKKKTKF